MHSLRGLALALGVVLWAESRRSQDLDVAAPLPSRAGAISPPQDIQIFLAAAEAYESRAIEVLQEIAPYQLGLATLAAEIDQRARMLDAVAKELEKTFEEGMQLFPFAMYAWLRLYFESQFAAELADRMGGFAGTVKARHRAYADLEQRLDAQLLQVAEHIANPVKATTRAPRGRR